MVPSSSLRIFDGFFRNLVHPAVVEFVPGVWDIVLFARMATVGDVVAATVGAAVLDEPDQLIFRDVILSYLGPPGAYLSSPWPILAHLRSIWILD